MPPPRVRPTVVDLPDGWTVWSEGEHRLVFAYRPDVFDGGDLPAPCLPTIYVARGRRRRRPGRARTATPDDPWTVTLFLEPEVEAVSEEAATREAALATARDIAGQFAAGEVDYRACYQVPRPDYFEALDGLTGRAP